jgi:hypothetical protein
MVALFTVTVGEGLTTIVAFTLVAWQPAGVV